MSQQLITANEISPTSGVANTGIVGLITSAQLQPNLTLTGTTILSGNLQVQGTTTTVNQEIVNTSIITSTSIMSPVINGPSTLALQASNTTAMFINSSNQVLIGTSVTALTPQLTVTKATTFDYGQLFLSSNDSVAIDTGGGLSFGGNYTGSTPTYWSGIYGLKEDSTSGNYGGYLSLYTRPNGGSGTERLRIDSAGNMLLGTKTSTNNLRLQAKLAIVGTSGYPGLNITDYAGTTPSIAGFIDFNRSRGTTDGSLTAVASGDTLGYIVYRGSDGSSFNNSAQIASVVDGTVSSGIVPGALTFTTWNSSGSYAERMRINSSGQVLVNTTTATTYYSGSSQIYPNMLVQGDYDTLYLAGSTTRPGLNFAGPNSASNRFRFAAIQGAFSTTTAGSEGGGLSFQTATNGANISEKAYLSTQGYFTTPYNPSFCYGSPPASYTTGNPILFSYKVWDTTNSYNSSTGRFTAPVTGTYQFGSVVLVSGSSSGNQYDMRLLVNSSQVWYAAPGRISYSSPGTSWGDGYIALGVYQAIQLNAGDYVVVAISTFGGGGLYSDGSADWSRFYGTLIG